MPPRIRAPSEGLGSGACNTVDLGLGVVRLVAWSLVAATALLNAQKSTQNCRIARTTTTTANAATSAPSARMITVAVHDIGEYATRTSRSIMLMYAIATKRTNERTAA